MAKAASKKFYPKNEILFDGKVKLQVRNKKEVKSDVSKNAITFKAGVVVFKKDNPVSKEDLSLMSDYHKKYYLEER